MNTSACPKCQTTIEAAAMACPSCGSISCRWVAAGLGVPVYLTEASRPTAALESTLRAAFVENLEFQRNAPPEVVVNCCTDINVESGWLQVVPSDWHADKFAHPVETPGLAFMLELDNNDNVPDPNALLEMSEVALFTLNLNPLDPAESETASIDLQTDVDAAAHLVARLLVSLHGLPTDGTVHVNTWND